MFTSCFTRKSCFAYPKKIRFPGNKADHLRTDNEGTGQYDHQWRTMRRTFTSGLSIPGSFDLAQVASGRGSAAAPRGEKRRRPAAAPPGCQPHTHWIVAARI